MKHIPTRWVFHCTIAAILSLAALCTGCASQPNFSKNIEPETLSFWKPHTLYLQSASADTLYVEIDAVQGSEPKDETIETLRQYLLRYCDKPGGIQIVRNAPIPLQDAQATRPELLALRHMDGPPAKNDGTTAYLYVLFYDSSELLGERYRQAVNPHAKLLPYPAAIYMDSRYIKKHHLTKYEGQLLLHEVGHIFGLTWGQKRGRDWYSHCQSKACLMYETYRVNVLPFRKDQQKLFCDLCKADLRQARTDQPDQKLRFIGPLMVRSEKDYHVISLPAFIKLHVGPLDSIDFYDVLEEARNEVQRLASQPDTVAVVMGAAPETNPNQMALLRQALEDAKNDPYHTVRLGVNAIKQQPMRQFDRNANQQKIVSNWWRNR